jgi:hypothetical protein
MGYQLFPAELAERFADHRGAASADQAHGHLPIAVPSKGWGMRGNRDTNSTFLSQESEFSSGKRNRNFCLRSSMVEDPAFNRGMGVRLPPGAPRIRHRSSTVEDPALNRGISVRVRAVAPKVSRGSFGSVGRTFPRCVRGPAPKSGRCRWQSPSEAEGRKAWPRDLSGAGDGGKSGHDSNHLAP